MSDIEEWILTISSDSQGKKKRLKPCKTSATIDNFKKSL